MKYNEMKLSNVYNESIDEWEEILPLESYWQPKNEDEFIEGKIIEIKKGVFGNNYSIKDKQGFIHITPSHKLLENLMSTLSLNDIVKIVFKGTTPTNKGNPLQLYKVYKKMVKRIDLNE
jgi:hypothetical protein